MDYREIATENKPARYYFRSFRVGKVARLWSALALAFCVTMMFVVRTPAGFAVWGVLALVGGYGLVRPAQRNFYVEPNEEYLEFKVLTTNRIRYEEIALVDFYRFKSGEVMRAIENFGAALGRFWGIRYPRAGHKGEIDQTRLEMRFVRTLWIHFPLPPFRIPKRSLTFFALSAEDAEAVRLQISEKLRPAQAGPSQS